MRAPLARLLLSLAVAAAIAHSADSSAAQRTVLGTFEAPPLALRTQDGQLSGYLGDYVRALQARSGLRFDVRFYPNLDELGRALERGEVDAAAPLVEGSNPAAQLRFTPPLERLPVAIVNGVQNQSYTVLATDLSGKLVAALQASILDAYIGSAPQARYVGMQTDVDALEALTFGRVDFALMEESRATWLIEHHKLSRLRIAGHMPLLYEPALAVRADRPELFVALGNAMKAIPATERTLIRDTWLEPALTPWYRRSGPVAALATALALLVSSFLLAIRFWHQARVRGRRLHRQSIQLVRSERMYRALASGISDMVTLHAPDGTILYASPSTKRLTGFAPMELLGRGLAMFVHPEDRCRATCIAGNGLTEGVHGRGTLRIRCRSGQYRSFEYVAQMFPAGVKGEYVVASRDATERMNAHAELQRAHARYRHLAYHDARTGLPNREGFFIRLNQAIASANRVDGLSVVFLDVDNFKTVNDSLGHAAGDELLAALASRLQAATHGLCELGRLGGDEFAALVPHADMGKLGELAAIVIAAFEQPISLRGEAAYLTLSAGVARFPDDGVDAEGLMAAADSALYAAKEAGKNTWRSYNEKLGRSASERAVSLKNLRNAFERGEFTLHYQPKVSLVTGAVTGYEALLRWNTASGVRGTGELIAAAEQSGFIATLGEWVVRTAAGQSVAWRRIGVDTSIAVNISAIQLHELRFVEVMRELIDNDPALPEFLVLEVTESTFAQEMDRALVSLGHLQAMGFAMHIDDFGTGYSSLSRLSIMPVDTLKIDQSFVSDTPENPEACEIVKGVVALARALKLNVIAEGVETQAQVDFLKAAGCSEAQGYFFGRPLAPEFVEVLPASPRTPGSISPTHCVSSAV